MLDSSIITASQSPVLYRSMVDACCPNGEGRSILVVDVSPNEIASLYHLIPRRVVWNLPFQVGGVLIFSISSPCLNAVLRASIGSFDHAG